jgi:hypothetical protein
MSPRDRLAAAKRKMEEWIENGVLLGWRIDADRETAYIYRAAQPQPEIGEGAAKLHGEGPVKGFVMGMDSPRYTAATAPPAASSPKKKRIKEQNLPGMTARYWV